jgi:hypothetical protein
MSFILKSYLYTDVIRCLYDHIYPQEPVVFGIISSCKTDTI